MPSPGAPDPHRNQLNRNERAAEGRGTDGVYKLSWEECYLLQTFIKTLCPARGPAGHWSGPPRMLDPSGAEWKDLNTHTYTGKSGSCDNNQADTEDDLTLLQRWGDECLCFWEEVRICKTHSLIENQEKTRVSSSLRPKYTDVVLVKPGVDPGVPKLTGGENVSKQELEITKWAFKAA